MVFVIGAGAGVPYGFPTGDGLRRFILDKLLPKNGTAVPPGPDQKVQIDFMRSLAGCGLEVEWLIHMRDEYRKVSPCSIDNFLAMRPEFLDVGKAAIAGAILPYEALQLQNLYAEADAPGGGDWIGYLVQQMFGYLPSEYEYSFVTFNYDRLLEHRLTLAYSGFSGLSESDAWERVRNRINIVHVHGQLGKYAPAEEPGAVSWPVPVTPTTPAVTAERMRLASDGLQLVHEKAPRVTIGVSASKLIRDADTVFFLGFGYDETNMRKLAVGRYPSPGHYESPFVGTVYGLLRDEMTRARALLSELFYWTADNGNRIQYRQSFHELSPLGCLELLRTNSARLS